MSESGVCVCECECERRLIVCTSYLFFTLTAFPLAWINPLFILCDKHKLLIVFFSYTYVYACMYNYYYFTDLFNILFCSMCFIFIIYLSIYNYIINLV